MKQTPLYDFHVMHGKLAEFAGYEMPLWYTSIIEEHLAVRNKAGIFDVSHMGRVTFDGPDATKLVDLLVPTRASSQAPGKSFYTLLLNPSGGIIDDLIIMRTEQGYMLVVNAANKAKDLSHIQALSADYDVKIRDVTDATTMIAVQGPEANQALQPLTSADLSQIKRYTHVSADVGGSRAMITRTGYTGEDGFEIILHDTGLQDDSVATAVWTDLSTRARPCGLGARDSLRIEAGLPLYGSDIDETTNPFEAELSWVVTKDKIGYVGSESLASFSNAPLSRVRRGIVLDDKIPRHDFIVTTSANQTIGRITSGTFSPILKKGIAIAYVEPAHAKIGEAVRVVVRASAAEGMITRPPFYDEKAYGWKRLKQQE
ncbi:MAG: glycine cleavage system aminomethyltransferase GcvT [Thaumarchaeota archaeon]|nr:glycine cleavage system aminomethyltransferase GcvT [Nitrososphaerota archaeon]